MQITTVFLLFWNSASPSLCRVDDVEGITKSVDRRSRPASTADVETFHERETHEEFAAIEEEESEDVKDNKNSG